MARLLMAITGITVVALAASACGSDEETAAPSDSTVTVVTSTTSPTTSSSSTTAATAAPSDWPTCTSPGETYTVAYPPGWSTNSGRVSPPCTFFHPEPFQVPEATEVVDLAVTLRVEQVPFETVADPGGEAQRELSRTETTVAGAPAVVVEAESTGDALLADGVRSYRYAVDLEGQTLVAVTYAVEGLDYGANKAVLDQMVESLTLST